jgi:hypothetical protein
MILGTARRVRPTVDLRERAAEPDLTGPPAWPDPRDHRDRGHFLTPRLYPAAPFDPWEPASVAAYARESM